METPSVHPVFLGPILLARKREQPINRMLKDRSFRTLPGTPGNLRDGGGIAMKITRFIVGLAFDIALKRLTRPHTVYAKLAVTALFLSGGAFITPFWQQAIEGVLAYTGKPGFDGPLPSIASGSIFLLLTFLFALFAQRHSPAQQEALVDTKSISAPVYIGLAKVHCYYPGKTPGSAGETVKV